MTEGIIISIIAGVFTFGGTVVTVIAGNKKTRAEVKSQNDVWLYRLEELEKKQDKHNTLIERMYKLEDRVNVDEEKLKVANHRIDDLEQATAS